MGAIRKYQPTDTEELLDAWYSASQVAHPFLDEDFLAREREIIASVYLPSPESETWVHEEDGVVVGFISMLGNEVGGLFVHAAHQRKGIGQQLMDHAATLRMPLVLDVFKENTIGRSFYQKYGFVEISELFDEETQHHQIRMKFSK